MKSSTLLTVLLASAAGAAAGGLAHFALAGRGANAGAPVAGDSALADPRLARLEERNASLERSIAELRVGQALLASRGERTAVDDGLAKPASAVETAAAPAAPAGAEAPLSVENALARLCDPEASYAERTAMWEKVNQAGLLDQVVDAMKQRVDREPNNPDLRVELGNAYLQEVFAAGEMSKGKWAMRADSAFDAALELDPNHWEARFTKAVALSNWPAFLGKQSAAITQFQTLIEQQNAGPKEPHHWQSYLYLGNMYQATGSHEKAVEAWQQGAALFPDNVQIQQQLANAKKP